MSVVSRRSLHLAHHKQGAVQCLLWISHLSAAVPEDSCASISFICEGVGAALLEAVSSFWGLPRQLLRWRHPCHLRNQPERPGHPQRHQPTSGAVPRTRMAERAGGLPPRCRCIAAVWKPRKKQWLTSFYIEKLIIYNDFFSTFSACPTPIFDHLHTSHRPTVHLY